MQVQLAERMREHRGQRVDEGTRIEYVITMYGGHQGKQYEKIEHIDYFKRHKDVIKLDYLYYVNLIANPIDQLLNIMYSKNNPHVKDFVLNQYKYRSKHRTQVLQSIQKKPTFVIVKQ
jgi:DNA polymerase elongation subunit (family B)